MATDWRADYALQPGDVIETETGVFTITEDLLFFGGSATVYSAVCDRDRIRYIIKEVFPNDPCQRFERRDGIIRVKKAPNGEEIEQKLDVCREKLKEEQDLGSWAFAGTALAVPVREILRPVAVVTGGTRYTQVGEGSFSVLDSMARENALRLSQLLGKVRAENKKMLHTVLCIIDKVLGTLDSIHSQQILFGDISADNIIFAEIKPEEKTAEKALGIPFFLDFGCARLLHGEKTDPITDKSVFSTYGYTPPELIYSNDGTLQLTRTADIFSVGALLLRALVSESRIDQLGRSPLIDPAVLQYDECEALDIGSEIQDALNDILWNAMNPDPQLRYPTAQAMQKAVRALIRKVALPTYLLPENLSSPEYFVPGSRDDILEILERDLKSGQTLFIHGVPGLGKSEVARVLAKRIKPPRGAYLIHYRDSMRQTILNLPFAGYRFRTAEKVSAEALEELEIQDRLRILREQYPGALLLIDNFNVEGKSLGDLQEEKIYAELLEISSISYVFTTRYEILAHPEWEIHALAEPAALQLLRRYCPQVSEILLKDIIREVQGHTLMLSVIGKSIRESNGSLSASRVLEALRSKNLSRLGGPAVTSDKDRKFRQAQIYAHLQALFDISGLSELQKCVLRLACFITGEGMPYYAIGAALWAQSYVALLEKMDRDQAERCCRDAMKKLTDCGWLKVSPENLVAVHPAIQELAIGELQPSEENCGNALFRMSRWAQKGAQGITVNMDSYWEAGYFAQAGKILKKPGYIQFGEAIREKMAKQDAVVEPYLKAVMISRRKAGVSDSEQTQLLEEMGQAHLNLSGHGKQAVASFLEALALRENDPETTREQLTCSLLYTGTAYLKIYNECRWGTEAEDTLPLADDYYQRALKLWKGLPPLGIGNFLVERETTCRYFETFYAGMLFAYYNRYGCPESDKQKILFWLEINAAMEDISAMVSLAEMYRDGDDCPKNLEKSYYWASMAAATKHKHDVDGNTDGVEDTAAMSKSNWARVFLAKQIVQGVYYTPCEEEKTYWIRYVAETEDPEYMIRYAVCLLKGNGCYRDQEAAFEWLCRVAETLGDHGNRPLVRYFPEDSHAKEDRERELLLNTAHQTVLENFTQEQLQKWYHRAVLGGNLEYLEFRGQYLLNCRDYPAAFALFHASPTKHSALAQYYVGWMYLNGFVPGEEPNVEKAIAWFSSASWELDRANLALAEIYFGFNPIVKAMELNPMQALFCCDMAASRRRNADPENYQVADILQMIETWKSDQDEIDLDSDIYFFLADFYMEHAPEGYREIGTAYLEKARALETTEQKAEEPPVTVNPEIQSIVEDLILELKMQEQS